MDYGLDPEALDVALALRLNMSLPLFYEPVLLKDTRSCLNAWLCRLLGAFQA